MARGGVSYNAFRNPAKSQNFIRQLPSGGAAPIYPLDGFPAPRFAYSTRTLRAASESPPVMIVRVSGPGTYGTPNSSYFVFTTLAAGGINTSSTVSYAGTGTSGATTLQQLLTAGGNNELFVEGIVNQMNSGEVMPQSTASRQPLLSSSAGVLNTAGANSRACIRNFTTTGMTATSVPFSWFADSAGNKLTTAMVQGSLISSQNSAWHWYVSDLTNRFAVALPFTDGNIYADFANTSTTRYILAGAGNAFRQSVVNRNGVNGGVYNNGSTLGTISTLPVGDVISGTGTYTMFNYDLSWTAGIDGPVGELIHWPDDNFTALAGFFTAQRTYFGL